MRVKTGRPIAEYSMYPEEKEVLIMTNTQFRVSGDLHDQKEYNSCLIEVMCEWDSF
jgi:hypothetical protein